MRAQLALNLANEKLAEMKKEQEQKNALDKLKIQK